MKSAAWQNIRPAAPALAAGILLLVLLFHTEAGAAIHVWNTSTAYGHCWLVLPLVAWLLWERRAEAAVAMAPSPLLAILALPVAVIWLAAYLLGIMEGRQLAAVACAEILLLSVLGRRLWWALSAAFLYLFFLVPFGAFVTPALQDFTAGFVAHGLDALNIPSRVTAYKIEIPEGQFYVAEACAGLRFLIASVAFGVLYAVTLFRSPLRRIVFILAAVAVPIIANGFRALGIVVLGHALGSAQAAETDHVLYGWIFFSIVILLLALAGLPFRQDAPASPAPGATSPAAASPAALGRPALAACAWVVVLAATGPALTLLLNAGNGAPDAAAVMLTPPNCTQTPPHLDGPVAMQNFACGSSRITARLELLPHRANPSRIVEAAQGPAAALLRDADLDGGRLDVPGATPAAWALQRDRTNARASAAALFIDGAPGLGGLRDRWRLTLDLLTGAGRPAAALVVAVTDGDGNPETALREFIMTQGDVNARVGRLVQ
jgi:exosortase A